MIRKVRHDDAKDISRIYNYYIKNSVCTFQEKETDTKYFAELIESVSKSYPWLVNEENDLVNGYAYARQWKGRSAYRYSVETSVYVDINHQKKGIGAGLLSGLIEDLRKLDVHCIVGGIALPNDESIALHEKFGFKKCGQFSEIGFKFGKWIDVGYWQLLIK